MHRSQPLVSVVTPTYNGETYLAETIRSVLDQGFSDFEYLIVDDASTDGTEGILHSFARKDPRIRCFRLEKNTGQPAIPRNLAFRNARGKYIALIDHDDLWLKEKLALQIDYMESHPSVGVTHGNAYNLRGNPEQSLTPYWKKPPHGGNQRIYRKLLRGCCVISCTAVARKDCVMEAGLFPEAGGSRFVPDDWLLWIKISRKHPFTYLDRFLALYRIHSANLTASRKFMAESDLFLFERYGTEMGLTSLSLRLALSERNCRLAKVLYCDEKKIPAKELWKAFRLNPFNPGIYGLLARIGFRERTRRG
jgi:glycosyltransferase involved in cell wall biosynthesis